jgi:hypothetical protein
VCLAQQGQEVPAVDGRKAVQELLEAVALLQVLEQGRDRDPGAAEDRLAAGDVGIADDDAGGSRTSC